MDRPWLDAYPPGVPPTYRYPDVTLGRLLEDAERDFDTHPALVLGDDVWTYATLADQVRRTAAALRALGIGPGARVATVLANTPAAVAVPFAVWALGATVVPLDVRTSASSLRARLRTVGAEVVIAAPSVAHGFPVGHAELPALRHVVVSDRSDGATRPSLTSLRSTLAGSSHRLRSRRAGHDRVWLAGPDLPDLAVLTQGLSGSTHPLAGPAAGASSRPAVIAFTRGLTGPARPVVLTHGNLVANAFQARLWVPDIQAGREVVLANLPFSHLYGFTVGMLQTVLSAGTCVLLDDPTDGGAALQAIQRHRVTLAPGLPGMFAAIVDHPRVDRYDLTSVRACLSGGAALDPTLAARFEVVTGGARLRVGYGVTEAGPLTHANPIYGRYRSGAIGLPVTDTLAVIADLGPRRRRLLPAGEVGELLVAGPQVGPGPWPSASDGASGATDPWTVDGWLRTGDLASVDAEGWFTLHARAAVPAGATPAVPAG